MTDSGLGHPCPSASLFVFTIAPVTAFASLLTIATAISDLLVRAVNFVVAARNPNEFCMEDSNVKMLIPRNILAMLCASQDTLLTDHPRVCLAMTDCGHVSRNANPNVHQMTATSMADVLCRANASATLGSREIHANFQIVQTFLSALVTEFACPQTSACVT